jgi:CRISPR-associated protein Cmr6
LKSNQEKKNEIKLQTTYPGLCTGVGMEHEATITGELKLGFYFDYTTGVPVIPGSTIKGVLRSAFPQWENHEKTSKEIKYAKCSYIYEIIKSNNIQWDDLDEKSKEVQRKRITDIEKEIFDGIIGNKNLSIYDRDIFLDAYISKGTSNKPAPNRILGMDAITPHIKEGMSYSKSMLKNPTPIPFLKVLPGVEFTFEFILHDHTEPNNHHLLKKDDKEKLFKQILLDFGIGAKTNVGYGQFTE